MFRNSSPVRHPQLREFLRDRQRSSRDLGWLEGRPLVLKVRYLWGSYPVSAANTRELVRRGARAAVTFQAGAEFKSEFVDRRHGELSAPEHPVPRWTALIVAVLSVRINGCHESGSILVAEFPPTADCHRPRASALRASRQARHSVPRRPVAESTVGNLVTGLVAPQTRQVIVPSLEATLGRGRRRRFLGQMPRYLPTLRYPARARCTRTLRRATLPAREPPIRPSTVQRRVAR